MNEIKYNPIELFGNWDEGWALDLHTALRGKGHKTMLAPEGYEYDHTYLGHLVYELKYELVSKSKKLDNEYELVNLMKEVEHIAQAIAQEAYNFLKEKGWEFDCIIPVPPSNQDRVFQPVYVIAEALGRLYNVPVDKNILKKAKSTIQLKNIDDQNQRQKILEGAFRVEANILNSKRVLVIDDLYRSGATLNEVCKVIKDQGKAKKIYVLVITKTRTIK